MLRGSSRHDGIPNRQPTKDSDRDRQREQQRKERAQMLPDEKEIPGGNEDLFNAPVKVKPSIDDTTTLQIRNSFGNFEPIRKLMENPLPAPAFGFQGSTSSSSLTSGSATTALPPPLPQTQPHQLPPPVLSHRNPSSATSHNINVLLDPLPPPPAYRTNPLIPTTNHINPLIPNPYSSSNNSSIPDSNTTKGYHRSSYFQPPTTNHHLLSSNNIISGSSSSSSSISSFTPAGNNTSFRVPTVSVNQIHNQIPKVSLQLHQHTQQTHSSLAPATSGSANISSSSLPSTISNHPNASLSSLHSTVTAQILNNSRSPSVNSSSNYNNSYPVKAKPSSFSTPSTSYVHDVSLSANPGGDNYKADGSSASGSSLSSATQNSNNNSVFNSEPFLPSNNSLKDAKSLRDPYNALTKKPPLERVDSQFEVESILKEMTDIIPPLLSAIQTPLKDSPRKLPQRRASKSESDDIVQSISGMAKVPSPVQRMDSSADSSSSYESDSDSESEDSASSGSQHSDNEKRDNPIPTTQGSPTTKWNLSSFLKTANDTAPVVNPTSKSPKDIKPFSLLDSGSRLDDVGAINFDRVDNVTSTVSNKAQSPLSLDGPVLPAAHETRAKVAARTRGAISASSSLRPEPHVQSKLVPPTSAIPNKGSSSSSTPVKEQKHKVSSLSASSSEDEEEEAMVHPKRKSPTKALLPPQAESKKPTNTGATVAKRPRTSGGAAPPPATHRSTAKSGGESSPENKPNKNSKNNQDKIKNDTIRKLFRVKPNKVPSPSVGLEAESNKPARSTPPSHLPALAGPTGKQSSSSSSRAKGTSSKAYNGDVVTSVSFSDSKKKKEPSKEREREKSSSSSKSQNRRNHKAGAGKTLPHKSPEILSMGPPVSRLKEEGGGGSKGGSSHSSLIIRIPLDKLQRKPPPPASSFPAMPLIVSPSMVKSEKEKEKKQAKSSKASTASSNNLLDSHRIPKVSQHSSRVGSSSDRDLTTSIPSSVTLREPILRLDRDRDNQLCSIMNRMSPGHAGSGSKKRPRKKSKPSSAPKKTKTKREPPDSRTKLDLELGYGEVSSAYAPCDSITRTPPVDLDVVQAPDSSLNPPHLPSPVVPPQLQWYSYFEKNEIKDELSTNLSIKSDSKRDQDAYLEEAKKLKHSADLERVITTQASLYLEAGLYFILTGIIMERDGTGNSSAWTMYRDTLTLIQYIGNRWRSARSNTGPPDLQNLEAKIITLSMRCQALLLCKLFKMKMKETKEMVTTMQEYFTKAAVREPLVISSPQLSTPSPHSPTSSPAASISSGVVVLTPGGQQMTPSPHHQQPSFLPVPRLLHNQIQKQCGNAFNCVMAFDTWEQADALIKRYQLEEFFIGIDRHVGPLTLHSTLVDLVRYIRHALQLINGS